MLQVFLIVFLVGFAALTAVEGVKDIKFRAKCETLIQDQNNYKSETE